MTDVLAVLRDNELLAQHSEPVEVTGVYVGFDVTAPSLHVGHMFVLRALQLLEEAKIFSMVVIGQRTAMIGDPSGRTNKRQALTAQEANANAWTVRGQLAQLGFQRKINNTQWKMGTTLGWFPVARLFDKSIFANLDGLTWSELSYPLEQATDWNVLSFANDVNMQIGGADQWGNLSVGLTVVKHDLSDKHMIATVPLFLDKNGNKIGKTARGKTIFLSREHTSDKDWQDFWLQRPDETVDTLLMRLGGMVDPDMEPRDKQHLLLELANNWRTE